MADGAHRISAYAEHSIIKRTRFSVMALHPRAHDDAPVTPIADMELGIAVALLGAIILIATILVPALA